MLKTMLRGLALVLVLTMGTLAFGNEVIVHGYTESGAIDATIDGQRMTVPDDMANMHRQLIEELWVGQGHDIPAYEPPPPSTNPADYPLQRYQFLAMLEIAGIRGLVEPAIDDIADPIDRAVARARWESTDVFSRTDPLLIQLATAVGLTTQQIDDLWMTAKDL